jgi:hypothetical protein
LKSQRLHSEYLDRLPVKTNTTTKEHLLSIYELRGQVENNRKDNPFVFGYDNLLPALRQTKHNNVCISSITTDKGTFIIFSNFDKTDFVGLLKSKRTLTEIQDKYQGQKLYTEQHKQELLYDYDSNKTTFVNGQLIL